MTTAAPLIAHLVFAFDTGGMENGMVNLLNRLPPDRYRHAVIALTRISDFRRRVTRDDIEWVELRQPKGNDLGTHRKLFRWLKERRPAILHTRNLATLEGQITGWLAGVPGRIHGEHGRDVHDLHGATRRYRWFRKIVNPLVHRHLAVSVDLARWLERDIGVPPSRLTHVMNGVDTERFSPRAGDGRRMLPDDLADARRIVIGTVGRMQSVKAQTFLARGFIRLVERRPDLRDTVRLALVGDGPLKADCERLLEDAGLRALAWMPGTRDDIPDVLRAFDVFVLPSLNEGISNTILEAMATGLPVIATSVGGNVELVDEGATGALVPSGDVDALAAAMERCVDDPAHRSRLGATARRRALERFSMQAMVKGYSDAYDAVLARTRSGAP